ncbi:hypothetical protein GAY29_27615 [Azospirillum brasilense]|uniref:hypothetical protein n=1 Tax=Azospirillum brasilense TaxID=192 RepID=UPI0019095F08|nr:hypothetical protein [Azospirillum brasilense]MBK3736787.1 hypothetical protein [Azospirillum brasilense]
MTYFTLRGMIANELSCYEGVFMDSHIQLSSEKIDSDDGLRQNIAFEREQVRKNAQQDMERHFKSLQQDRRFVLGAIGIGSVALLANAALVWKVSNLPLESPTPTPTPTPTPSAPAKDDKAPHTFQDDYGKVLFAGVPTAIAVLAGWMGFMGMKRLHLYDEEMHRIRTAIDERVDRIRTAVDDRIDRMRNDINERYKQLKDGIGVMAADEIRVQAKAVKDTQDEKLAKWKEETNAITAKLERFDYLREYAQPQAAYETAQAMGSLERVHEVVQGLFAKARNLDLKIARNPEDSSPETVARRDSLRQEALMLVEEAIKNDVSGDHDDYFNLATELARQDHPGFALKIIDSGIARFSGSPDLVGTGMEYAVGNGDLAKSDEYFEKLNQIGADRWNWRAFTFAVKYNIVRGDEDGARRIYDLACIHLPDDERPAVQYAQMFLRRGKSGMAIDILDQTMGRVATAPQAALQLAQLYKSRGKYAKAMEIGKKALTMNALDQSRINMSSVHLTIGLAGEAQWTKSLVQRPSGENNEHAAYVLGKVHEAKEFLAHYAAALESPDSQSFAQSAIDLRLPTVRSNLMILGLSSGQIGEIFRQVGLPDKSSEQRKFQQLQALLKGLERGMVNEKQEEEKEEEMA